ncbi:hypothetical protein MNEG_6749 [Monoraphidium neglectum]|jgi:hypothetical protein|uniref:Uncharacterized protein n=1 Tax=Monoraphidium neglectum TaxID=145388 RepID=A0A0D2MKY8_9CHLO|nr:hypothetical protein MNEG_6749 [Monoraphidium neglectum]KIZ01212.1 hypothetical protein MNEG_6749 [Monoraphidium neglectum]|eukprot:XP_013900231.1 hypothetical protein MNEG_6749 [Monoraphidium neglectum]
MVIAAYATAVRLTAAAPINLAAAATLASRPAALAALDALPAADLAAKAERLDMTPAELRELIQTSEAINFDAESGYLHYR